MESSPQAAQPRPQRRSELVFQEMPDGTGVIVDPESGASYALNATGAEVWALCDGAHTEAEIVAALLERYEAGEDDVARSVTSLLAHLRNLGVLS